MHVGHSFGVDLLVAVPGDVVVTGADDGTLRLWDLHRRAVLDVIRDPSLQGTSLHSRGGRAFVRVDGSDRMHLYGETEAAKLLPDGLSPVAAVSRRDDIGWIGLDRDAGKLVAVAPDGTRVAEVDAAIQSGMGKQWVSADGSAWIRWQSVQGSGTEIVTWFFGRPGPPRVTPTRHRLNTPVAPAPDGTWMALGDGPEIVIVSTAGAGERRLATLPAPVTQLAVSFDGTRIVAAAADASLALHDARDGRQLWRTEDAGGLDRLTFDWDDRRVVGTDHRGNLHVFSVDHGRRQATIGHTARQPFRTRFLDRDLLAALTSETSERESVALWALDRARVVRRTTVPGAIVDIGRTAGDDVILAWRPAGPGDCGPGRHRLVVDVWRGIEPTAPDAPVAAPAAGRWPPPAGTRTAWCLDGYTEAAIHLASGRALVQNLATAAGAGHDLVVDLGSGARTPLSGTAGNLSTFKPAFSRGGEWVVTGHPPGVQSSEVWDARSGASLGRFGVPQPARSSAAADLFGPVDQPPEGVADCAALSADGRLLALADFDRIAVRRLPGGDLVAEFSVPEGTVQALDFAAASTDLIVTITHNQRFELYDLAGRQLARSADAGMAVDAPAVDAERRRVATVENDSRVPWWNGLGAISVWDLGTGRLQATLLDFVDDEYIAWTPAGAYAGSAEVAERLGWTFDGPLEHFRFEQFAARLHRPDIVARRLAGDAADVNVPVRRPPGVAIIGTPQRVGPRRARLRVAAGSRSRVDVVRAYVEGRLAATATVCAPDGEATLEVGLLAGRNRVTVVAFDDAGLASNVEVVDISGAGTRPDLWVVAVGISRYRGLPPDLQLSFADDDARGVADALSAQAGPGKPFATVHRSLLIDEQASERNVLAAVRGLARMKEDDVAVVFFAGHGARTAAGAETLLLTGDVRPAELPAGAISWRHIAQALARVPGRVIVLLDACHSGHVSQDLVVPNDDLAAALARSHRAGAFVFAAAKGRQQSYEPGDARALRLVTGAHPGAAPAATAPNHGYFTGALLSALTEVGTDADSDGAIQLSELVDEVTRRVVRLSAGQQTPWVARREIFGDFTIAVPSRARP